VPELARDDVAQARLVAQRLAGLMAPTPAEAVQWLTAMQAQDYSGALTSVGLLTRAHLRAEVVAALDTGDIVRSWPMRSTLHLTAAQDLSWMLRLLTPRVIRGSAARRRGLGLDEPQLEPDPQAVQRRAVRRPTAAAGGPAGQLGQGWA